MREVVLWVGAGEIGKAIVRRIAAGRKVIAGDKRLENARCAAEELNNVGFDVEPTEVDLSERDSILAAIDEASRHGVVKYMVNSAGVSPSQASVETILNVDLYGTAILLEEVGKKPTNCWRPHRPKRCSFSIYCSRPTYAIRSMPTNWPNVAT